MKRILFYLFSVAVVMAILLSGCQKKEKPKPTEAVEKPSEYVEEATEVEPAISEAEEEVVMAEEGKPREPAKAPVPKEEERLEKQEKIAKSKKVEAVEGEDVFTFYEGVVTFLAGEAEVNRGEAWSFLDVEDSVLGKDRVKTGVESFCEVQFTDFGIIRIQQLTEVLINSILLKENNNKVKLKLSKGNLLCKIGKLSKGEEFQVETGTVLAGVRGTEFLVKELKGGETVIAVNEGSVQVVPTEIAEKIEAIKGELQSDTAKDILEEIALPDIVVKEQEEVVIEREQVQEAVKEFEKVSPRIEERMKRIDQKAVVYEEKQEIIETKPEERTAKNIREVQRIKKDIDVLKEGVVNSAEQASEEIEEILQEPEPVSQTSLREIEEIDKMKHRDFVIAAKKVPAERAPEKAKKEEVPPYTKLTIQTNPKDANIFINGEASGKGKFSGLYESGTEVLIRIERPGYKAEERTITIPRKRRERVIIKLESPILWRFKEGTDSYVRRAAVSDKGIIFASAGGTLLCLSAEGEKKWSVQTNNRPNENSMPVRAGETVVFTGSSELVAVDTASGAIVKRISLGEGDYASHLFGRPVVPFGETVLCPSSDRLILLDSNTFEQKRNIPISDCGLGSPAIYKERLLMVNQKGEMLAINPETGVVEYSLATGAFQPVGSAPTIRGNLAAFADNKGTVVLTDLSQRKVLWQKRVGSEGSRAVYQNVVMGENGVYPYTGNTFYPLSLRDGKDLFSRVSSSCNPLYHNGNLYLGEPRASFIIMDAQTGEIIKQYTLDSPITLMPVLYGEGVIVATRSGTIYMIDTRKL